MSVAFLAWGCECESVSQHSCMHLSAPQACFIGVQLASLWVNIHLFYQSLMGQLTLISNQTRALTVCPSPASNEMEVALSFVEHTLPLCSNHTHLHQSFWNIYMCTFPLTEDSCLEMWVLSHKQFPFPHCVAYSNQLHNIGCLMPAVSVCVCD